MASEETCANCHRTIGSLEEAYIWNEQIVCSECYQILSATKRAVPSVPVSTSAPPPSQTPSAAYHSAGKAPLPKGLKLGVPVIIGLVLIIIIGSVIRSNEQRQQNEQRQMQAKNREARRRSEARRAKSEEERNRQREEQAREDSAGRQMSTSAQGETVSIGYTSYCVWRSWWSKRLSDNEFLDDRPNAMFLFVDISVRNNSKKARMIPPFTLVDENGSEYEVSSKAWSVDRSIGVLESLNPSVQKQGVIVFDIPTNHNYWLKVSGGYWSTEDAFITLEPN